MFIVDINGYLCLSSYSIAPFRFSGHAWALYESKAVQFWMRTSELSKKKGFMCGIECCQPDTHFFVNSNIIWSYSLICFQSFQTRLFLSAFLQSNQLRGSRDSIWKWYLKLTADKNQHLEILHNQEPSSVRPWLRRLIYRARETDWEIRGGKKKNRAMESEAGETGRNSDGGDRERRWR